MRIFWILVLSLCLLALSQSLVAQTDTFPPELKGYEFFSGSPLKSLKFYISTATDVRRVMGDECERSCVYNNDWTVGFSYIPSSYADGSKPRPEFAGTLASIGFSSNKPILLPAGTVFPDGYRCSKGVTESAGLRFASQGCMIEHTILIMYDIADENMSDGKKLVLKDQLLDISYGPPIRDRNIFAPTKQ